MSPTKNMMLCKNWLRNVLLYFRTNGHNQISCRTCAFQHMIPRPVVTENASCSRSRSITTSALHFRLANHTTKRWKVEAKGESLNDDLTACEQGAEAVPHSAVTSCLQDCSSVQEQANQLCLKVSLSKEDVENRKAFAQSLYDLLIPYFPNMGINLFGSSVNGFGFKGCDCDISIDVKGKGFSDEAQEMKKDGKKRVELPTVDDVESGRVALETLAELPPRLLLRFIRRVFRQYSTSIQEPISLVKARHSILRFNDEKYNLFCDFSAGNGASLQNTRVIRFVGNLDERVMPLIKVLRYWGKHHGFIGGLDKFNSYSFSLMVVYFLQNTSPPVLPSISELLEKSGYLLTGNVDDEELLLNDLKKFSPSRNSQTIDELLREFFFYYMYFDFSQVLCPLTSTCAHKMNFRSGPEPFEYSTIALEDPFRASFNLMHAAAEKTCRDYLRGVLEACQAYQKHEMWFPNPENSSWGISSLFDPPTQGQPTPTEAEQVHTIEIPLEVASLSELLESGQDIDSAKQMWFKKASEVVIDVFKHGLLFKCNVLKSQDVSNSEQTDVKNASSTNEFMNSAKCKKSIVKILCRAHHNVFSGRSNFRGMSVPPGTVSSLIEKEHIISVKLSKRRDGNKSQALFSFQCECLELQNDVPTLLVSLTFENYQPVVVVFLKEYLPSLVQRSL